MKILAFDTSTEWCSVAVGDGARWHGYDEQVGQAHGERLLALVDRTLREAGCRLRDLDGIAFGAGPGSFTGVRISCGVAQGLALGAGLPVLPVPTLAAIAQHAGPRNESHGIVACLDARMREVYVAMYVRDGSAWRELLAPAVLPPSRVRLPSGAADVAWAGAGNGFAAYPELGAALGLTRVFSDARPDAQAVAELALPRLAAGEGVAAADALPLYVRHRVALSTAERAAGQRL
jgi:tRNA threonylcarbamoyladenosine biosynthesis protein TsaB